MRDRLNLQQLRLCHLLLKITCCKCSHWINLILSHYVICKTHLHGLSPPTGDVAVLQLLRLPSSLSFIFLRSGVGMYPLWLLLLGRYWLKGRGVRSSVTEVRRTDMSSLRTSGIFLWGGPSDSESLPRPVGGQRPETKGLLSFIKDSYCVEWKNTVYLHQRQYYLLIC